MNLSKIKIILDKINRLYASMSLDEENVATIEKDLMRDYIKQLYGEFMEEKPVTGSTYRSSVEKNTNSNSNSNSNKKVTFTPPVVEKKTAATRLSSTPPPPPPVVESRPITPPPPPKEVPGEVATSPADKSRVTPSRTSTNAGMVDPEHAELFDINLEAKELSDKLSHTRISDLNNAMGINERIYTINELFGADNSLYREVIKNLNSMSSFEEAKVYLSNNVAEKFNWTHKSKRNKAKNFIKVVRRRYL